MTARSAESPMPANTAACYADEVRALRRHVVRLEEENHALRKSIADLEHENAVVRARLRYVEEHAGGR